MKSTMALLSTFCIGVAFPVQLYCKKVQGTVQSVRSGIPNSTFSTQQVISKAATDSVSEQVAENEFRIRWRMPRDHVSKVRDRLHFSGEITPDTERELLRGGPLAFVLIGTVLVPYLADALLAIYRDITYGGLVVEVQDEEIVIKNDVRVDGGTFIIRTSDGVEILRSKEIEDPIQLINALRKAKRLR